MKRPELERSADIIEQASETTEVFLQAGIANVRAAAAPEEHPDFDGEHCVECGCAIRLDRLRLKYVRCLDCQSLKEQIGRQYHK